MNVPLEVSSIRTGLVDTGEELIVFNSNIKKRELISICKHLQAISSTIIHILYEISNY